MLKRLCFALALAGACAASQAADAAAPDRPRGSLVIIGGGLRADNAEVGQKIVALAGGKGRALPYSRRLPRTPRRKGGSPWPT